MYLLIYFLNIILLRTHIYSIYRSKDYSKIQRKKICLKQWISVDDYFSGWRWLSWKYEKEEFKLYEHRMLGNGNTLLMPMTCATMCSIDSMGSGIPSFLNRSLHCSIISPTVGHCTFVVHKLRVSRLNVIILPLLHCIHVSALTTLKKARALERHRSNIMFHIE